MDGECFVCYFSQQDILEVSYNCLQTDTDLFCMQSFANALDDDDEAQLHKESQDCSYMLLGKLLQQKSVTTHGS